MGRGVVGRGVVGRSSGKRSSRKRSSRKRRRKEINNKKEEWRRIYQQQISTKFSKVFYKKGTDTAGLTKGNF